MFRLQFDAAEIPHWVKHYSIEEDIPVERIGANVRQRGYYTMDEFKIVCRWKTTRSQPLVASNDPGRVEYVTRAALATYNEAFRMEMLTSLHGVHYPTASVLLHFGSDNLYPILDFRALWSLGYETPPAYTLEFWLAYTECCRTLASEYSVSMRTLDRALWAYSKVNQGA